jgi:hypothetical protein
MDTADRTQSLAWRTFSDQQSGVILACIVDENFDNLHQRISEREEEVLSLRREGAVTSRKAS